MNMQEYWEYRAKTDSWSDFYGDEVTAKSYNFITRRQGVLDLLEGDGKYPRILDIGCGTGDFALLGPRHEGVYIGIDFSPSMAQQATERFSGHGLKNLFLAGSGVNIPCPDDTFDLAIGIGYIEYFHDPDPAVLEIRRVLKPGGVLVLQSFKWDFFTGISQTAKRSLRKLGLMKPAPGASTMPGSFVDRKYSKGQLDRLLESHGFKARDYRFNNFHVFPGSIRGKFPGAYIGASERMYRTMPDVWRFLAANYIGKYVLDEKAAS